MNIALIGYGYWGQIVSTYIKNHKYFKLKKIYDTQKRNEEIFTNDINEIIVTVLKDMDEKEKKNRTKFF